MRGLLFELTKAGQANRDQQVAIHLAGVEKSGKRLLIAAECFLKAHAEGGDDVAALIELKLAAEEARR